MAIAVDKAWRCEATTVKAEIIHAGIARPVVDSHTSHEPDVVADRRQQLAGFRPKSRLRESEFVSRLLILATYEPHLLACQLRTELADEGVLAMVHRLAKQDASRGVQEHGILAGCDC